MTEVSPVLFLFRVCGAWFGTDVHVIRQVTQLRQPSLIPGVPSHILGLVPHGQDVLPVLDLARFLQLQTGGAAPAPEADREVLARLLVVTIGALDVAIPVDQTGGLLPVAVEARREVSVMSGDLLRRFLKGEFDSPRGVAGLLDLPALLEAARV